MRGQRTSKLAGHTWLRTISARNCKRNDLSNHGVFGRDYLQRTEHLLTTAGPILLAVSYGSIYKKPFTGIIGARRGPAGHFVGT